ncbi:MAG: nucleotide-binding universal stress UspA family protein [Arenicella sp.]
MTYIKALLIAKLDHIDTDQWQSSRLELTSVDKIYTLQVILMLKEISVCVNDIEQHPLALVAACKFAQRYAGRVTATYLKIDIANMISGLQSVSPEVKDKAIVEINEQHDRTKKMFESLTQKFDIPIVWRSISGSLNPVNQLICSDIIFVNQIEVEAQAVSKDSLIYRLILETKRPILMIPHCWDSDNFGNKTLLGWDNSPEAMRAVSAALPLLQESSKVEVLDILDGRIQRDKYEGLNHIEEYLSRNSVLGKVIFDDADQPSKVPGVLAKHCNSGEFDLLVIGAYGHTKDGKLVMEGATNQLIFDANIPVLFSH